jgi:hypothetical protein
MDVDVKRNAPTHASSSDNPRQGLKKSLSRLNNALIVSTATASSDASNDKTDKDKSDSPVHAVSPRKKMETRESEKLFK